MKPALFTPAAEADVEEAVGWYEGQRRGLGRAFLRAVDVAVAAIEESPEAFPVIHRNARRFLLPKFPYLLFYRVFADQLVVVGCIHAKRHPRVWRSRLSS